MFFRRRLCVFSWAWGVLLKADPPLPSLAAKGTPAYTVSENGQPVSGLNVSDPNTGTNICLNPWKLWCSLNAMIAVRQVIIYRRKVPMLLISVVMSNVFGHDTYLSGEKMPNEYQML